MSTTYNTEPPPTATVTLHTTAGPVTISLFAQQAPLASRNFLQHILDGYYDSTVFHRVVPGFVVQGGDPTGTGEGGTSIYEDAEFEYGEDGEKVVFGDEKHSRLHFNRRGLVGMAKMTDSHGRGSYGSQFFITLADCRAELDGKCTMFGRVEGEGIYNVVKIAEGDLVEGTERPMYPVRITKTEIEEMPKGASWEKMRKRDKIATKSAEGPEDTKTKKKAKKKGGKTLLSFGAEDGEEEEHQPVVVKKAKFNTSLIAHEEGTAHAQKKNGMAPKAASKRSARVQLSTSPTPPPPSSTIGLSSHHRAPSLHDSTTQLPLRDPEKTPSSPPSPGLEDQKATRTKATTNSTAKLNAEITALKQSMRRDIAVAPEPKKKKSALEQMIPETSIRGRKRRHDGGNTDARQDSDALKMLNAFRKRLDGAQTDTVPRSTNGHSKSKRPNETKTISKPSNTNDEADILDEEAQLCDLHFIANCQSCTKWDEEPSKSQHKTSNTNTSRQDRPDIGTEDANDGGNDDDDDDARDFMTHSLSFAKDRLGKDLTWKKKAEEELVVIDPREKEREIVGSKKKVADRERDRRKLAGGSGGGREWDRR